MINRYYSEDFESLVRAGKVLIVYGPRRTGKTTLIQNYIKDLPGKIYSSTGENTQLKEILESSDFSKILPFFADYDLIVIDEAQKVENIGQGLKIIVDQLPEKKVIATGSASFDLSNKLGEPLVGRQNIIRLYPISAIELREQFGAMYFAENLENLLIYGSYPEVVTSKSFDEKRNYLMLLRDSYLYRDIIELENIKNSRKILDLLRLLAFQIGKEVSIHELGSSLDMSKNTVEKYLDLLEKSFVIVNIRGFSRNLRSEITKTSRYYFYDNGVRNAVIENFNPLNIRNDIGQLWENFLVMERIKKQSMKKIYSNNYFWRTWEKKEIDWVEEREGKLFGFEFKWGEKIIPAPTQWVNTYPESEFKLINKDNYLDFIS